MSVNAADSTTEHSTFPYKRTCPFSMPREYGPMMEQGSVTKVSLITGLEVWAVTDYHLIRQLLTDPADQLLAQARELPPST